jgi:hypothetical protein
MKEETIFRTWLWIVASTRLYAIVSGYMNLGVIRANVYPGAADQVTPLFGRMFSNWTLLAVALVICLALYPRNKQIYVLNLISFAVAFFHMILEVFHYGTMGATSAMLMAFFSGMYLCINR